MIKFKDIESILTGSSFHIPLENDFTCGEDTMFDYEIHNKPTREIKIEFDKDHIEKIYKNQYKIYDDTPEYYRKHMIKSGFVSFDGDRIQTHPPTYNVNEYGFRSDNFSTDEEGIICLGCSDTFGDGQFEHQTWPRIVAQNLNMKCYNLAVGGTSLDGVYRHFKTFVHKVKSNNVFLLTPSIYRTEFYVGKDTFDILPMMGGNLSDYKKQSNHIPNYMIKYYLNYINNMSQLLYTYNKNIDAIQHICNEYDMNLFVIPNPEYYDDIYGILKDIPPYDRAVDGKHRGIIFQKNIANTFLEIYRNGKVFK